jgi:nicotinate dehydrogenase subunit A
VKQTLLINGQQHTVDVDPDTPLLFVLQDELHLNTPHFGCGMAQCGACTVLMGSQVVRSCVKPMGSVGRASITTLEGLGTPEKPHPIQRAFIEEGASSVRVLSERGDFDGEGPARCKPKRFGPGDT